MKRYRSTLLSAAFAFAVSADNDAGISGGIAEAPDLARKTSGRDNE